MKEFELSMRLYNNRMRQRRLELEMNQHELAVAAGIHPALYNGLETMRESPFRKDGGWRPVAVKIAEFHGVPESELWPDAVVQVAAPVQSMKLDAADLNRLLGPGEGATPESRLLTGEQTELLKEAFDELTVRERAVLERRFAEDMTLQEAGGNLPKDPTSGHCTWSHVGGQRVREIEGRALRKLRHRLRRDDDGTIRRTGARDAQHRYQRNVAKVAELSKTRHGSEALSDYQRWRNR